MKLIPSNGISIGQRQEQQDEFGFSDPLNELFVQHAGVLAVVVDGMGGVRYGSECAQAGKAAFLHAYESKLPSESIRQALQRSLTTANEAVLAVARRHQDPKGVGATLTAAVVWRDRLVWVSVGDSAIYVLRNGQLQRLTASHDTVGADGQAYISSFLGLPSLTVVDIPVDDVLLQIGDRVLVCSDGLFRTLSEAQIAHVLGGAQPGEAGPDLVNSAIAMNVAGQDNVTAIVLSCEHDDTPSPITSNISDRPRRWQIAAVIALAVILFGGSAAYGWYRYRNVRAAREVGALVEEVNKAFDAGNCAAVHSKQAELLARAGGDIETIRRTDSCGRFLQAVREGDDARQRRDRATPTERDRLKEEAQSAYQRALAEGLPAAATDSVRKALDSLSTSPDEDTAELPIADPTAPAGENSSATRHSRERPPAPASDDDTRQPISKPKKPGGRGV